MWSLKRGFTVLEWTTYSYLNDLRMSMWYGYTEHAVLAGNLCHTVCMGKHLWNHPTCVPPGTIVECSLASGNIVVWECRVATLHMSNKELWMLGIYILYPPSPNPMHPSKHIPNMPSDFWELQPARSWRECIYWSLWKLNGLIDGACMYGRTCLERPTH